MLLILKLEKLSTVRVYNTLRQGHLRLGLHVRFVYEVLDNQFWIIERWLHTQIMELDFNGSTIVYHRNLWEKKAKFAPLNMREDATFVDDVFSSGANIFDLSNHENFVYIRHNTNTWRFPCGEYGNLSGWRRILTPEFVNADDLSFYRTFIREYCLSRV